MAQEVVMPQMGLSMDSGRIIRWIKQAGDSVEAGDVLLEVEAGKATVEVEAAASGKLQIRSGPDAGDIPVGATIGYILKDDEELVDWEAQSTSGAAVSPQQAVASAVNSRDSKADGDDTSVRPERPPSSPAARRRAKELGVDWQRAEGTGPASRIKVRDVERLAQQSAGGLREEPGDVRISPVARRVAEMYGVDIDQLAQRHPGARVERRHVDDAIREAVRGRADGEAEQVSRPPDRKPMSSLRRLIADRMSQSARTTAPVTLTTEAEASRLVSIRQELKDDLQLGTDAPSYNAMLAKIVAMALIELPYMNTSLADDEILYHRTANVGIAVDTGEGLVVPVLRNAEQKSLLELSREADELLTRASAGEAQPRELEGGTFTITNLGVHRIDAFTPIINPPECAVLGVGRLRDRVIPEDGRPVIRTMMALSLTFDHRLVDGAPAARFLDRVRQLVEMPHQWLMDRG